MKLKRAVSGFTIVELLIVVMVVGILAAITIVAYNSVIDNGRETKAKATAADIANAVSVHYTRNSGFPTSLSQVGFESSDDTTYAYTATTTTFCAGVDIEGVTYYVSSTESKPSKTNCGVDFENPEDPGDIPLPTPIAEWKFNEGSGSSAADSSGHNNTLAAVGSPWTASGKTGAGFNPSLTNYFTRTSGLGADRLDNWTVTLWFQRTGTLDTQYGQFMYDNNEFWADIQNTNQWGYGGAYSASPLPQGEWHHLAWVVEPINFSNSKMTFYRDGVYSHETNLTGDARFFDEDANWMVGRGPGGVDGAVKGIMDDLRVYEDTLTQTEVQANANL